MGGKGAIVTNPVEGENPADGVLVISVWGRRSRSELLGRLTMTTPEGDTTAVVSSPEEVLESVRTWLDSLHFSTPGPS